MFERAALPRVVPFLIYMLFILIADLLLLAGWEVRQLHWLYGVKVGAVLCALLWWRRSYSELAGVTLSARWIWVSIAVGLLVLVLWLNLGGGWMRIGTPAGFDPTRDGHIDWPLAMVRLAGATLVVPVMEELFWRSFLLRWLDQADFLALDPASTGLRAAVGSGLLFGFEHDLWLAGVAAGLAYGALYRYSRQLWVPVLAHGVTNGCLGVWIIATAQWTYW